MTHVIRPLRPDDADQVASLLDWAWFAPRSAAGWTWLSQAPRGPASGRHPLGYAAEDADGRIGAMYGLFAQDYVCDGEAVTGATGHTFIVHPRMQGAGARLLRHYARTPDVFGVFHFNANARSAPLYPRFGFEPSPTEAADLRLVWAIDPLTILAERAARYGIGSQRPEQERFNRERVFTPDLILDGPMEQVSADQIDARFDRFWAALAAEGGLLARRDAASLRWRLSDPDRTLDPFLVAWMEGGEIAGYALAQIGKMSQIEAPNLEIIDVVALSHCADRAVRSLVWALVSNAQRLGVARVRLSVVTPDLERRLDGLPGLRRVRRHAHGHARLSRAGRGMASNWRLTSYDADYGFCLRAPPAPSALKASRWSDKEAAA